MAAQFPPPQSFIRAYGASTSFAGLGAIFTSVDFPTPCTVRRVFYLPNTTAGQPSEFPLRLIRGRGPISETVGGGLFGGVVLASWRARAGREFIAEVDIDVPESGWLIGTWLTQTSGIAMIQSARFSVLPWVDGVRPNLRRTQTPRNIQRFNFSNVVVAVGVPVIRSTPLISSSYIITTITYRGSTTAQSLSFIRPFVGRDLDTVVPAGTRAVRGAIPGTDILSPTKDAGGFNRVGYLGCHTQWQNHRPWKNVRFAPSAIKLLFDSFSGTQTFTATVEIEYLRPLPWWKEASLLELARGL